MNLEIELVHEPEYTRWWANIDALPGVAAFGKTKEEAIKNVKEIALQDLLWQLEDGDLEDIEAVSFKIAEAIAA